jgi:flagellar biosynthesis protein FlhF
VKTLSFLGETPTLALQKAVQQCGEEALVLHTKKIATEDKNNISMYEVLIGIESESEKVQTTQDIQNNAIKSSELNSIKNQILKMQQSINNVQKTIWFPKGKLYDLNIPPEFVDMYELFKLNEFDKDMIYVIFKKTIKQLPVAFKENPKKVNDFFRLILRRLVPIKHEVPIQINQKKIMMLVGPTGVGKTTSIAKIAARYAYKMPINYKVGIITLDSFRVGAVEQLKSYAELMRLPFEVINKTDQLSSAIERNKDSHYILIDTAGSSQYDMDKIETISQYQQNLDDNIVIEKTLVLPANIKTTDLYEIYSSYSFLGIDNLHFTKLDETKSFGSLISFAQKSKKSISFLSMGQNVPDDLMVADSSYIIDCFMNQTCKKEKNV